MFQRFQTLVREAPDRAALIDGRTGAAVSRRDLLDRGRTTAAALRQAGLAKGDLVAVQLPNSIEFVATWLAVLQEGFVLHTYPYRETSLLVEALTRNSGRVTLVAKGARRPRSSTRSAGRCCARASR